MSIAIAKKIFNNRKTYVWKYDPKVTVDTVSMEEAIDGLINMGFTDVRRQYGHDYEKVCMAARYNHGKRGYILILQSDIENGTWRLV